MSIVLNKMFLFHSFIICFVCTLLVRGDEEAEEPPPNIQIKYYRMCKDVPDTPVKFSLNPKKESPGVFHLSGDGSTPYDIGENVMLHFVAETYENDQWNTAIKLDEKDPCKLLNDYVAEQWHAIQEKLKMPVGECPIPKGSYIFDDYVLDLEKIAPLNSIPKGRLRFQANATLDEEVISCVEAEFEST